MRVMHARAQGCTLTAVASVCVCVQGQGGAVHSGYGATTTFCGGWTFSLNTGRVRVHHTVRCRGVGHWLTLQCCLCLLPHAGIDTNDSLHGTRYS